MNEQDRGCVAKAELAEERFKVLKANADSYKLQIQALEKKNNNYSVTVAKYEQSISHMKDECVAANAKLSRAEVGLEHLRREYQLLKESEARLVVRERGGDKATGQWAGYADGQPGDDQSQLRAD
ncbi:nucleoprotein TPR-like [Homalodisca vitripennis]|uniref:nucleoprotein TPR-like n=1 Tax=Homalodisca vitripennis TaxID=197043 RepID=UPI001EEB1678|nr:nucleoprotein TPR-like [Homalodisca vitripennis]